MLRFGNKICPRPAPQYTFAETYPLLSRTPQVKPPQCLGKRCHLNWHLT
jgi:hypothetical protein